MHSAKQYCLEEYHWELWPSFPPLIMLSWRDVENNNLKRITIAYFKILFLYNASLRSFDWPGIYYVNRSCLELTQILFFCILNAGIKTCITRPCLYLSLNEVDLPLLKQDFRFHWSHVVTSRKFCLNELAPGDFHRAWKSQPDVGLRRCFINEFKNVSYRNVAPWAENLSSSSQLVCLLLEGTTEIIVIWNTWFCLSLFFDDYFCHLQSTIPEILLYKFFI